MRHVLLEFQDGVDTGEPSTSFTKLIAVHAGFEEGHPAEEQLQRLRQRLPVVPRIEELSGRKNVYENLPVRFCILVAFYCLKGNSIR